MHEYFCILRAAKQKTCGIGNGLVDDDDDDALFVVVARCNIQEVAYAKTREEKTYNSTRHFASLVN